MTQSLNVLIWATFTVGIEARIFQSVLSTWYRTLISMLNAVVGQNIYDAGQSIADLGKLINPRNR